MSEAPGGIRPGQSWGGPGVLGPHDPIAANDLEIRELLEASRRGGRPFPTVGLVGGDLARTLGARGDPDRLRAGPATEATVDVGEALLDGVLHLFVAHMVARRGWWRGRALLVMNAEWLGSWDVAPRGHPGDGRLDLVEAAVAVGERAKVRARLRTGSHLPHPGLRVRRISAHEAEFRRPTPVWLDGQRLGPVRRLAVRVRPAALTVVV